MAEKKVKSFIFKKIAREPRDLIFFILSAVDSNSEMQQQHGCTKNNK
jgi:hypothetical protein